MKYVYPAIFTEEDGKILVDVPDLPGTYTFGDDLPEAIYMAADAIAMWLWDAENNDEEIPAPTPIEEIVKRIEAPKFASLIACDTLEYRKTVSTKSIIKSVSIPEWLDHQARLADAPLSAILQQGLKTYLGIESRE
jgi:predicted RNase H-like HicB family nuclease